MSGLDVLFVAVGLLTAGSGLLAVISRQVLHAALWLVVTLAGLAGCYLVLGAELVGLVQLLVYVGAVVVLFVLALMVTRSPLRPLAEHSGPPARRGVAALAGLGTTALLLLVLLPLARSWDEGDPRPAPSEGIAAQVFGTWVWPFELLSLLLLVALVAALAITRERGTMRGRR